MPTSRAIKPADGRPASYASYAAAALPTREGPQTKPARGYPGHPGHPGHPGPPKNPFEALAQGVRASTSQMPHLRAPVHNASITNSANLNTGSNLPPHKRTPPVYASYQPSKSSTRGYAPIPQGSSVASLRKTPIVSSNSTITFETPAAKSLPVEEIQDGTQENISKPSKSMNSGFKDKSAANDSAFPCSYQTCDRGFYRAKDLKRHKIAEHEWCSNCDLDFEDDVALIEHRIASTLAGEGKHVACLKCGDDFGCEAGRKRHTQLVHREVQEIKCPGCGAIFERAATLVAHVSNNRCKDRSGLVSNTALSKGRVDAALEIEQLAVSSTYELNSTDYGSVIDSVTTLPGGVGITQSLLDRDDEAIERGFRNDKPEDFDDNASINVSVGASEASSDEIDTKRKQTNVWSSFSSGNKGKENQPGVGHTIEGLDKLSVAGSHRTATTQGWTKALFPDAERTPVKGGWTQPKAQTSVLRGGRGTPKQTAPMSIINGRPVRTDWDHYVFDHDVTGRLKCPFQTCDFTYLDVAPLKVHLISGFHQGTGQQCVKCLKTFKSPIALLAHMESASQRCNLRDTEQYGHVLYMVSGGFIDVNDDEKGIRLADGQLRMRARTKAELAESEVRREEEQRERERRLEAQW